MPINITPFNFLKFSYCPIEPNCAELVFLAGDPYQDFVRLDLPAGTIRVTIVTTNGVLFYELLNTEFSYSAGVLTISIENLPPPVQEYQILAFTVLVNDSSIMGSNKFILTSDSTYANLFTRLVRFAFNDFPNDYIHLRLPIVVKDAIPSEAVATKFETSNFRTIRVTQDTQENYALYWTFLRYKEFGRNLFNSFMQAFWSVMLEDGYYRRLANFEEYGLEYEPQEKAIDFNSHPELISSLVFNDSQIGGAQIDLASIVDLDNIETISFYIASASQAILEDGDGQNTSLHRIQLDLPVAYEQQIKWQIVPLGNSPAVPQDFNGSMVYPSGELIISSGGVSEVVKNLTINKLNNSIIAGVNYEVVFQNTDLIRFDSGYAPIEKGGLQITWQNISMVANDLLFGTILNTDTGEANEQKQLGSVVSESIGYTNEVDLNGFNLGIQLLANNLFLANLASWGQSGGGTLWSFSLSFSGSARCLLPQATTPTRRLIQNINLTVNSQYDIYVWGAIDNTPGADLQDVMLRLIFGDPITFEFVEFKVSNFTPNFFRFKHTFTASQVSNAIGVQIEDYTNNNISAGSIYVTSISLAQNNSNKLFSALQMKNFLDNRISSKATITGQVDSIDGQTISAVTITKEVSGYSYSISWGTTFSIGDETNKAYMILKNTDNGLIDGFEIGVRSDGTANGVSAFELGAVNDNIEVFLGFFDSLSRTLISQQDSTSTQIV